MKKVGWFLFVFFAIGVGLYPFGYLLSDTLATYGLLSQKSETIKESLLWSTMFKVHIYLGGLALMIGWPQFIKNFRNKNLNFHRMLGKVYLMSILLSGVAGLYIGYYAEGGWVAKLGFIGLAIAWLYTSCMAYLSIRKLQIDAHKRWMIRSYALTFAAVTLRIWLPLFQNGFGMEFISAYVIIAWLCWVPNLLWAEWYVRQD
ncbi:MAG: hypothetical protein COW03_07950 [Cytophagales bacterium CG12_big_fil_rev_8_21_14_0_65_40_12]|nr:MAG: hypothetical protein COW03_07950 [Cytophagales bacterium CG12_big_fil_rev_8_21_14_0_65_40_12]PIW06264.1 MAG: hypothetical protein COW40_00235 [Cytophagales bacterium CG17_big_fil_post_rev_8_21_14_2_50_40_13]